MKIIKTKATIFQEKKEAVIKKIENSGYRVYSPHGWGLSYEIKKKIGISQPKLTISLWNIDKKRVEVEDFSEGYFKNKVSEQDFVSEFEKKTGLSLTKFI